MLSSSLSSSSLFKKTLMANDKHNIDEFYLSSHVAQNYSSSNPNTGTQQRHSTASQLL
jgi:hypothetical protein